MHIFITGGTGFIGQALCQMLLEKGYSLTLLTRQSSLHRNQKTVQFCYSLANLASFDEFDAIINLAGEPIFEKRWTTEQKQILLESRLTLTKQIVEKIKRSDNPPHTFLSGSATGIYGNIHLTKQGDEQTPCSDSFTGQLCQQWEKEALQAHTATTRICLLRTGIVMDKNGGALKKILPLYRLGLGGQLGSGKQHWAWISLYDQVNAICFLLENMACNGAYNLVAPMPLTNAEFNASIAKKLHRPAFFRVPTWGLKWVLGERAQILLDNQPLAPARLLSAGFTFRDQQFPSHLL